MGLYILISHFEIYLKTIIDYLNPVGVKKHL